MDKKVREFEVDRKEKTVNSWTERYHQSCKSKTRKSRQSLRLVRAIFQKKLFLNTWYWWRKPRRHRWGCYKYLKKGINNEIAHQDIER